MHTFFLLLGTGLVDAAIIAPASVALTLQFGVTNYVNFAYGQFLTFAAYMAWTLGTPPWNFNLVEFAIAAALLTAVGSLGIGMLVYTPFVRRRPQLLYALVLTFAVSLILGACFQAIWGSDARVPIYPDWVRPVHDVGPFTLTNLDILFVGVAVASLLAVHAVLRYTKLGKAMRAMSDDFSLAIACGLPTGRITSSTWAFTGFVAGLAGVVLALQSHGFDSSLGANFVYLIFAAVVIGGIGRPYGAVVGALVIGLVYQLSPLVIGTGLSTAAVFAVLVSVMLLRPAGILGSTGRSAFVNA